MDKQYECYCRVGACPSIIVNNNHNLTVEQSITVLKRLLAAIENGLEFNAEDSTQIGDKYTHCSWGTCTDSNEIWNKPEYHIFPKDFVEQNRNSAIQMAEGFSCPMRETSEDDPWSLKVSGCFWQCRVFQKALPTPTREETLELYRDMIEELEDVL